MIMYVKNRKQIPSKKNIISNMNDAKYIMKNNDISNPIKVYSSIILFSKWQI